jgi:acetamidase/formamidase
MTLAWPRAETPTHFISMGTNLDLTQATRIAIQEMIDFLVATKGLDKHTAYQLTSVAGDGVMSGRSTLVVICHPNCQPRGVTYRSHTVRPTISRPQKAGNS